MHLRISLFSFGSFASMAIISLGNLVSACRSAAFIIEIQPNRQLIRCFDAREPDLTNLVSVCSIQSRLPQQVMISQTGVMLGTIKCPKSSKIFNADRPI